MRVLFWPGLVLENFYVALFWTASLMAWPTGTVAAGWPFADRVRAQTLHFSVNSCCY